MYVRLGAASDISIVQPANPTPLNDAALYPQTQTQTRQRRTGGLMWPQTFREQYQQPARYYGYQQPALQPQPTATAPASGLTVVGYDASGNPIYGTAGSQASTLTASVSATPGGLSTWLQTGNNGIYAAIGVALLLLLLTRRR